MEFFSNNGRYNNFLSGIKLEGKINLPIEEPQRSIFKDFMFVMTKKVQKGEWTRKDFNDWKKTLVKVNDNVLCRVPDVFLQALENEPEINKETAILVRSFNLERITGSLNDQDIEVISKGIKNHTIIDVFRDITTKGYQVTNQVINERFKDCGLDDLEIILEQLLDSDDNPIKDKLRDTFSASFEYVRCIAGVDRLVAISEENLISNAVSVVSSRIRSEYAMKEREINSFNTEAINRCMKKTKRVNSNPWNDSSNR